MSKYGYEKFEHLHFYEVVDLGFGFKIIPQSKTMEPIWIFMDRQGFWNVAREGSLFPREVAHWNGTESVSRMLYGDPVVYTMFELRAVVGKAVGLLYSDWKPKKINGKHWGVAPTWMKQRTAKCLMKPCKPIMDRIIDEQDDEEMVELHRKFYSLAAGQGSDYVLREMLENRDKYKYQIKDAINIYAVRVTYFHFAGIGTLIKDGWLKRWEAEDNPVMRKTLSQYTGYGLPYYWIGGLYRLRNLLRKPLTTRLQVLAHYAVTQHFYIEHDIRAVLQVLARSDDDDIREAIEIAHGYMGNGKLDYRRVNYIRELISWVLDVVNQMEPDDVVNLRFSGLARRSLDYHQHMERWQRETRLREEARNAELYASKTALPPIDLPDDEHIQFLDTYKSVVYEGREMQHCVGGYASSCVDGRNFIFHIDYCGDEATVQVTREGRVYQAYGPNNCRNRASEYGKKALMEWANGWPEKPSYKNPETNEIVEVQQVYDEIPF